MKRSIDADPSSSRADETRTIINNVNTLSFSSGGTGLSSISDVTTLTKIEISLTTKGNAGLRTLSEQLNTEVDLRNR